MKLIQIGFAATIAISAMSFTIAEYNGVFNDKSFKATADCFLPGGTYALQIKSSCSAGTVTITTTDPCSIVTVNHKVWSLDANNVIPGEDVAVICAGGNKFCCFKVTEDSNPCSGQPTLTSVLLQRLI